ncbi:sugar ABC transporter substrate-binding protein [Paenibacillus alginolyticus]|uniref:Sugar ABC transporter substrate-binding protein n=1 Tax=Paenibacillus alginolyticus TaxID=59839 RepID=A0ABT4GM06_9BACL|nr:sugar ABC transporter substrate-binding protein [Paenibacillus alginolyticus]MCY9667979.1 sugar ABC transporter substrate-binding protein [Paenibacillus alginolyticus]MCY9697241.1 sugar ABC transporter substrate-binding protein [Paenibacillus alginolyticus]MEC0145496.1 sugar ABC transporter substrate-binding protein [Paenibacillus alginolyticus]
MEKINRLTSLFLVTTMAVSMMAACSSNSTTTGGSSSSPGQTPVATTASKKDVALNFWTISLSPNFDEYIKGRIKKFQDANPGITVKWTDLPYGSMENKLLTSIAGGNSPDVVNLNTGMTLTLAAKNALVDLNKEATDEQRSIYFPDLYNSTKIGNSAYAFPWYFGLSVFMYNKKLYEQAGLDVNKPPTTMEEMKQQAIQIKQKTGKYGFTLNSNPPADLYFSGVPIISPDKKKIIVNTPEALAWAKWNKDLYDQGVVPKDSLSADANYATDKYQAGEIATLTTGANFLNRVKQNAKDVYDNTLVSKMPALKEGGKYQAGLMDVVVPSMSKNHKEAIAFANFITNDESQLEFCKVVNILPSTKKAAQDPFFTQGGSDPESKAKVISASMVGQAQDFTLGIKDESKVLEPLWKGWTKMLLGQQSPEDMLKSAEIDMQKILDQVNADN